MKRMKKLFAILMTMAMVMGLGITGFAAEGDSTSTISVTNLATEGDNNVTYNQILKPDVTATGGYVFADGVSLVKEGGDVYTVAEFLGATDADKKAALTNPLSQLGTKISGTVDGNNTFTATVSAGTYAVFITNDKVVYEQPIILSVEYDDATPKTDGGYTYDVKDNQTHNTAVAKYTSATVTKDADDDDNIVAIGTDQSYTIETYIPDTNSLTITDTLTGAIYNEDSVRVYIGNDITNPIVSTAEGSSTSDNVTITNNDNNGIMSIIIPSSYLKDGANASVGQKITVKYSVKVKSITVNNNVVVKNPTTGFEVEYGEDDEKLTTSAVTMTKYNNKTGKDQLKLEGAGFKVYYTVNGTKYWAQATGDNGNYTLTGWTTDEAKAEEIITATGGTVTLDGLEANVTYMFKETKAPSGYSLNGSDEDVIWTKGGTDDSEYYGSVSMTDTKLSALPSTGGMGTTLFTIAGCVIMISAAGLFFATRKKAN